MQYFQHSTLYSRGIYVVVYTLDLFMNIIIVYYSILILLVKRNPVYLDQFLPNVRIITENSHQYLHTKEQKLFAILLYNFAHIIGRSSVSFF